jgi:hypothetical protein
MAPTAFARAISPGPAPIPGAVGAWLPESPQPHGLGTVGAAWLLTSPPARPGGIGLGDAGDGGQPFGTDEPDDDDSEPELEDAEVEDAEVEDADCDDPDGDDELDEWDGGGVTGDDDELDEWDEGGVTGDDDALDEWDEGGTSGDDELLAAPAAARGKPRPAVPLD